MSSRDKERGVNAVCTNYSRHTAVHVIKSNYENVICRYYI
jgi:hypothetical protein